MAQPFEPNPSPAADAASQNLFDSPMRKFLRSRVTKAFLTKDGGWTQDLRQAMPLTRSTDPRGVTRDHNPQEFEIYYSFDENGPSQWDFAIPLH